MCRVSTVSRKSGKFQGNLLKNTISRKCNRNQTFLITRELSWNADWPTKKFENASQHSHSFWCGKHVTSIMCVSLHNSWLCFYHRPTTHSSRLQHWVSGAPHISQEIYLLSGNYQSRGEKSGKSI